MIAFNLSGANNINMDDMESWPLPDVFPQRAEESPLDAFAEGFATHRAYLSPDLQFFEFQKIHFSSDEIKRKLGWEGRMPFTINLYYFPYLDTLS